MVAHQPGVLRATVLLWRDARPEEALADIVSAREPKKLPVMLSAAEIARFLEAVPGLRSRAALTTAYGAGLRVSEVSRP